MPGAAVEAGAAGQVLPLSAISGQLRTLAAAMDVTRRAASK